jgi:hypothetical protein
MSAAGVTTGREEGEKAEVARVEDACVCPAKHGGVWLGATLSFCLLDACPNLQPENCPGGLWLRESPLRFNLAGGVPSYMYSTWAE